MNVLGLGIVGMSGNRKKDNRPFSITLLRYAKLMDQIDTAKFKQTAVGYEQSEIAISEKQFEDLSAASFPCNIQLEIGANFRGQAVCHSVSVQRAPLKSAA